MPFNSKKKKSSWCYSDFLIKVPLISLTFLYFPVSVLKELSIIFIMEKENSHLKWLDIWKIVCLEHIKINLWIVVSFLLSDQKKKKKTTLVLSKCSGSLDYMWRSEFCSHCWDCSGKRDGRGAGWKILSTHLEWAVD